jgi:hypothetical protein
MILYSNKIGLQKNIVLNIFPHKYSDLVMFKNNMVKLSEWK